MYEGVGAIIRNKSGDKFFVQQKDAEYAYEYWIGAFSFWGGEVEESDLSAENALMRELEEEVPYLNRALSCSVISFLSTYMIDSLERYRFSLYEIVLLDKEFDHLPASNVLEGRASVRSKDDLLNGKWVWGLEQVVNSYFGNS